MTDERPAPVPEDVRDDLALLFDPAFYLAENPDVAEAGIDPLTHYMKTGAREDRDPSADFSARAYRARYGLGSQVNPLVHYIRHGRARGYSPRPETGETGQAGTSRLTAGELIRARALFDAEFYRAQAPEAGDTDEEAFAHYMKTGARAGLDPSPDFDVTAYRRRHRLGPKVNPLIHHVRHGDRQVPEAEPTAPAPVGAFGLSPAEEAAARALFDADFYMSRTPEAREDEDGPFGHYMKTGAAEGRDPAPGFSGRYYRRRHRLEPGTNPLVHYIRQGRAAQFAVQPSQQDFGLSPEDRARVLAAFDMEHYIDSYADVGRAGFDPFGHFMTAGWREHRDPSPAFSTRYYLKANPDIREGGINPFVHWVLHGQAEGRPGTDTPPSEPVVPETEEIDWASCPAADVEAVRADFDSSFYCTTYPEVEELGVDPVVHYLLLGWRRDHDPNPWFSTRFYLDRYPDIRDAGVNPFLHYCQSGRAEHRETQSYIDLARRDFRPLVSVIVPNYNHAPYLRDRITSIARQGYDNIELIILDDCSPDNSREVIREVVDELGIEARLEFNEKNAGNVFAQWKKGLSLARGELIWICESDDFCEPDFLERVVPAFADESVNIAFGRIQFSNAEGEFQEGLDQYREGAEPGIWDDTLTRPAAEWFHGAFGVNNVIANVGGSVFRKVDLPDGMWETARSFRICADWYLYMHIAGAGQITFEPRAVTYFRQHASNTSATNFHRQYYYDENLRILRELIRLWGIPQATREKFLEKVRAQWRHFGMEEGLGDFDAFYDTPSVLDLDREVPHVQLHFLGFHTGGGELFPINLANAFVEAGVMVSMVAVDMLQVNADMRARLNRRVPVYFSHHVTRTSRGDFLKAAGVSVINSHMASADAFLASCGEAPVEVPYVVTLHGSYVSLGEAPEQVVNWILRNVSGWIYTADRNLEFFEDREVDRARFAKMHNAMPRDPRPAPFTRADLGIGEEDTVFVFVARGVKRKGWRAAVEAFRVLREVRGIDGAHLLMIGAGEATDDAMARAEGVAGIHFLGYQSEINGILRLSDVLVLPSRFEGESYPLCLIQAIQEHVPAVATDLGEIRSMMTNEGEVCGLIIEPERDTRAFTAMLAGAMEQMTDPTLRAGFRATAGHCAERYDMARLVQNYLQLFQDAEDLFDQG